MSIFVSVEELAEALEAYREFLLGPADKTWQGEVLLKGVTAVSYLPFPEVMTEFEAWWLLRHIAENKEGE